MLPSVVLTAAPLFAQPSARPAVQSERTAEGFPVARAVRVERGPDVDGDVLADAAWANARPVTGFRQNTPREGEPASERTVVRIVYTDDTIYFGVVCFVRDPDTIIVSDSRRDSSLAETDSFQIVLDTYRDRQNGFVFGTNPAGLEYDGQLTNEGQGSGGIGGGLVRRSGSQQQRGSGGGFNLNWDGVWQVATRVTDVGWTAEIAIPFRTVRYPAGATQTWGLNFQRKYDPPWVLWTPKKARECAGRCSWAHGSDGGSPRRSAGGGAALSAARPQHRAGGSGVGPDRIGRAQLGEAVRG